MPASCWVRVTSLALVALAALVTLVALVALVVLREFLVASSLSLSTGTGQAIAKMAGWNGGVRSKTKNYAMRACAYGS